MFLEWTDILIRLAISAVLCGAIGLEREYKHKPVGFRTNMLVGLGSTLIMIISLAFVSDSSRIAAGVITGIGFLGGGLILRDHDRDEVRGTTTAASVWLVAAIGLAVGLAYYTAAIIATVIALIVLFIFGSTWVRTTLKLDE